MTFSNHFKIGFNVHISKNVKIGNNSVIDSNVVIYDNVQIGENCFVRSGVVLGELNHTEILVKSKPRMTIIGDNSIIGSGTIVYSGTVIGSNFRSGNHTVVREDTIIGDNCSIGTFSDIQGRLRIGNHVRIHSNCFIPEGTMIEDFVWIYPSVTITNDLYPPHGVIKPVLIKSYAQVGAGSVVLPGVIIGNNSFAAAGSVVTKNVDSFMVVMGSPARVYCDIRELRGLNEEVLYPWKDFLTSNRGFPWEK